MKNGLFVQSDLNCANWLRVHILFCMKNVLLIDSGSGGVNILKECVRVCPYCNFLLFCDDKNLPYGSKSKEELQKITIQNLKNIKKFFDFEIVVLACNTLSCTCLERVRREFGDVTFVGTVPAVKPALENFEVKDVLVLATEATIKHNVLIRKNPDLHTLALPWLASEIDAHLDELEVLKPRLVEEIEQFLKIKINKEKKESGKEKIALKGANKCKNTQKKDAFRPKAVVLGCTHYLAVKGILQEILGEDVQFFDSANGVARRLRHFVLEEEEIVAENSAKPSKATHEECKIRPNSNENTSEKPKDKKDENKKEGDVSPSYQVQIMVSGNQNSLQSFWWWFEKE